MSDIAIKKLNKTETYLLETALDKRSQNPDIMSACYYISALHRLDLSLPCELLKALLPNLHVDDQLLRYTHGLMMELKSGRKGLVTRHAMIANIIFEQKQSPAQCYTEIINATQNSRAYFIARILHTLHMLGENYLGELFSVAAIRFPFAACFSQMHAILAKEQGDVKKARELFEKAGQADPKNAQVWQAWAILEKEQGDVKKARELFEKAGQADPKDAQVWHEWAIFEFERNNIGNLETKYTGRWLFHKATLVNSSDVIIWQAWAVKEFEQNNIGTVETEYSARWLLQRASQIDPQSVHVWQAWAVLEKKLKRWPHAECYFLRAAEYSREPKVKSRIYFDLYMMFFRIDEHKSEGYLVKSVEANPEDSIAHARLAKLYGFQSKWDESEKHFQISLNLKPDDEKTKKWYENMLQTQKRYRKR